MERNEQGIEGGTTGQGGEATGFSDGASSQRPAESFDFEGANTSGDQSGVKDRARNAISGAGDRLAGLGSTVRDRAGTAKVKLADALESGAERLRHRGAGNAALAGAGLDGTTTIAGDGRAAATTDKLATGMDATAEWLREADLASLKTGIERQAKEHPGRTLLIAAGLGYLIGRAFRASK